MSDKPHPASPGARLADLNRQGFMRGRKARTRKEPPPIVACDACLNWHPKGKHTATREERAANIAAEKARQAARLASVRVGDMIGASDGTRSAVDEHDDEPIPDEPTHPAMMCSYDEDDTGAEGIVPEHVDHAAPEHADHADGPRGAMIGAGGCGCLALAGGGAQ